MSSPSDLNDTDERDLCYNDDCYYKAHYNRGFPTYTKFVGSTCDDECILCDVCLDSHMLGEYGYDGGECRGGCGCRVLLSSEDESKKKFYACIDCCYKTEKRADYKELKHLAIMRFAIECVFMPDTHDDGNPIEGPPTLDDVEIFLFEFNGNEIVCDRAWAFMAEEAHRRDKAKKSAHIDDIKKRLRTIVTASDECLHAIAKRARKAAPDDSPEDILRRALDIQ